MLTEILLVIVGILLHTVWDVVRDWLHRIRFHHDDFEIHFYDGLSTSGEQIYSDSPSEKSEKVRIRFSVQFWNNKAKPIGLHRVSLRIMQRTSWWSTRCVLEVPQVYHGRHYERVTEWALTPRDWTSDQVRAIASPVDTFLNAHFVQLCAYTPDGTRRVWFVSDINDSPAT